MARAKSVEGSESITERGQAIVDAMTVIEEAIIQTKSKSSQDPLNYPVRLNDKLGALMGASGTTHQPTEQVRVVFDMLVDKLEVQLDALEAIIRDDVPAFNDLVFEARVPAIILDEDDD